MAEFKVGQRVIVKEHLGVVAFVGTTFFAPDVWVGVELDEPAGKNNGTVQAKSYFQCKPNHGLFVKPSAVSLAARTESDGEINSAANAELPAPASSSAPAALGGFAANRYEHRGPDGSWTPFDDSINSIIASAQQGGETSIRLPEVSSNPPDSRLFEIRFGNHAVSDKMKMPSETGICQVNLSNQNTRKVRRVQENATNNKRASDAGPLSKLSSKRPVMQKKAVSKISKSGARSRTPSPVAQPAQVAQPAPMVANSTQGYPGPLASIDVPSPGDPPVKPQDAQQTAADAFQPTPQQVGPATRVPARGGAYQSRRRGPLSFCDYGDEDPLPENPTPPGVAAIAQPEPEVSSSGILSVSARVEYKALPRGSAQDIFGLVTIQAGSPPENPQPEGDDAEGERQPMDIICVLDVSGSMQGDKIRQVQDAVRFVIEQGRPCDRIGIVAFNSGASKTLRLRRMNEEGKNDANVATLRLRASGGTDIASGLSVALSMMENRRQRNKVSALLLLTDGQDSSTRGQIPALISRAAAARCSLYPFGFGSDHDAALLADLAEQARTPFTFVEDVDAVREAFAGAVGGLASVVAQNLELSLSAKVPLTDIHTPFEIRRTSETQATVIIPDIMAEERRDVLVELSVPADTTAQAATLLLETSVRYIDLKAGVVETPTVQMETERCDEPQPEQEPDEEVSVQRERVEVTKALKEAAACSDQGQFDEAQLVIERTEQKVRAKKTKNTDAMCLDLQDARSRMKSRSIWEHGGKAEISDACQMHSMQRSAMESNSSKAPCAKVSRAMYVSKAQKSMISKSRPIRE